MKSLVFAALAASAALTALPAAAADKAEGPQFYGNVGYTFIDGGAGVQLGAVTGRAGVRVNPYFGVEGEGAIGVDGDHVSLGALQVNSKLRNSFAGYAVAYLPISDNLQIFARGGYGTNRIRQSIPGLVSDSENFKSWNYGAGVQYLFDGKTGVRLDYTRYHFTHGAGNANTYAAAVSHYF